MVQKNCHISWGGNMKKKTIVLIILDILILIGIFLTYGPYNYPRELFITTAMTTKEHQFLARTLFSDATINRVMTSNYVAVFNEDTNIDEIDFNNNETTVYDSIYEEQILKKDPNNDLYKIIPVSGPNYAGYITVIYDPSRVTLALSKYLGDRGQSLKVMAKNNNAKVAINASGFLDINWMGNGGTPTGNIIHNGKVYNYGYEVSGGGFIGFNDKHVLMLLRGTAEDAVNQGLQEAVEFGPFLIVNGKPAFIKGNGGWGIAPRTAIAQRKDGIVLFVTIDGRQPGYSIGIDMVELTKLLTRYKAHNAANLDGGSSTGLVVEKEIYNKPVASGAEGLRDIPNAWILK
jgi:exopolysaccharide biosynthesis protein